MRNRFERQLEELNNEIITMGALCEEAIETSIRYLFDGNEELKELIADTEKQINGKERDIEVLCMKLLMQQQPVAGDLRIISSALKMISDLERIGDQALDIASMAIYVEKSGMQTRVHIRDMANATMKMVQYSIESFVKKDVELAYEAIRCDDEVDRLFNTVKNELVDAVANGEENGEALIDLVMIAKYFERIGDHAENIAEWVIYSITGEHV
ncbi:MAG: phosphate signaling complex protein PhoU [Clostridia bacterium]|nr:phosphate signaling complex protein PhoU [Clostridia bacterium]